jgi:hypothetical protein
MEMFILVQLCALSQQNYKQTVRILKYIMINRKNKKQMSLVCQYHSHNLVQIAHHLAREKIMVTKQIKTHLILCFYLNLPYRKVQA